MKEVISAPRSPWQNAFAERLIGSIRRECLDHVAVLSQRHLRKLLKSYFTYYHRSRTHLALAKAPPNRERSLVEARSSPSLKSAACTAGTKDAPCEGGGHQAHSQSISRSGQAKTALPGLVAHGRFNQL